MRSGPLTRTISLTSLLLQPLKQRLIDVTSFSLSHSSSRSVPFNRTSNLGSVFTNSLNRTTHETKILDTRQTFSFHFIFVVSLVTSSTLKTFLLLVTAAMLSRCQSRVTAGVETQKGA
jgi:hypothetical protein